MLFLLLLRGGVEVEDDAAPLPVPPLDVEAGVVHPPGGPPLELIVAARRTRRQRRQGGGGLGDILDVGEAGRDGLPVLERPLGGLVVDVRDAPVVVAAEEAVLALDGRVLGRVLDVVLGPPRLVEEAVLPLRVLAVPRLVEARRRVERQRRVQRERVERRRRRQRTPGPAVRVRRRAGDGARQAARQADLAGVRSVASPLGLGLPERPAPGSLGKERRHRGADLGRFCVVAWGRHDNGVGGEGMCRS